jgi:MoaA/NifB/PqqE/SkfB family radical SAM enzyme
MRYGFLTRFNNCSFLYSVEQMFRRQSWLFKGMTPSKLVNMTLSGLHYVIKRDSMVSYPIILKIDISPLCNLHCPVCIHARPQPDIPLLQAQKFRASQKLSMSQFSQIVDEVKGRTLALSLYYAGDPYMHPDIDGMCSIAHAAKINVHLASNFSFRFSEERIASIATSGLTHLSICLDGISQQTYERTRVGGNVARVMSNIERICHYKRQHNMAYPKIEIQTLRFKHNQHEIDAIRRYGLRQGVDEITVFPGREKNWIELEPENNVIIGPRSERFLPLCFWPYVSMVIKYNGDVIPCCYHRQGNQYTDDKDKHVVGNVFSSGVYQIWNSAEYKRIRRLVASPQRASSYHDVSPPFCSDCRYLFMTKPIQ